MGSSRPNCARRFARTSGGTLGLVASSSNGSPGARARMVKRTRLMPNSAGIRMRRRRSRYLDIAQRGKGIGRRARSPLTVLGLAVPVLEVPEIRIPATLLQLELVRDRPHARPPYHGDDDSVLDHQVIHLDVHGCALGGIQLALRGLVELVEFLVLPA